MNSRCRPGLTLALLLLLGNFVRSATPCLAAKFYSARFDFAGKSVTYEASVAGDDTAVILLLHGASGPGSLYQEQARLFADQGFTTIVPFYFDATKTSQATTENYKTWAALVAAMAKQLLETQARDPGRFSLWATRLERR